MKKLFVLATILMVMAVAPNVQGATVTLDKITGYFYNYVGEYTLKPSADWDWVVNYYDSKTKGIGGGKDFQSFCLEATEPAPYGQTNIYNVVFNDKAIYGGVGPSGDPISKGTAWLYYNFALGTLSNYDYIPPAAGSRDQSANALQFVIWWLEGEGSDPGNSNIFREMVITKFGSASEAMEDNEGLFPVAALNLYFQDGKYAQDFLVVVPEPATMLLLGSGLLGMAGYARRRFKK